jgi:branched-subunit amino acid ABC-type transport system permease component
MKGTTNLCIRSVTPSHIPSSTPQHSASVRVWDLPTRLFHWLLLACVIGLFATAYAPGSWIDWHARLGYALLTLLLFRLVWGVIGGHWSRFIHFVPGSSVSLGHTLSGALAVMAMLLALITQVTTGLVGDDEIAFTGPLNRFIATDLGLALRAIGNNPVMARANGVDQGRGLSVGLAAGNGLVALAGALVALYQGFADVSMGIGSLILGLVMVIVGEAVLRPRSVPWSLLAVVVGAILFRLLIAVALQLGLEPVDLKLATALLLLLALALGRLRLRRRGLFFLRVGSCRPSRATGSDSRYCYGSKTPGEPVHTGHR